MTGLRITADTRAVAHIERSEMRGGFAFFENPESRFARSGLRPGACPRRVAALRSGHDDGGVTRAEPRANRRSVGLPEFWKCDLLPREEHSDRPREAKANHRL